ncbi:MAG: protease modulator HflC, partial [Oscillospiraceae bacterium]|nr:protease modulator HflC [Oscillospiraceae bacterium]
MKKILVILLILALIIVGTSLFTVGPKEYVAVREFGRIVRIIDTPGLYLKTPFIQSTQRVSAATILYDIPASDVITKDKKSMISDNFV